MTPEKALSTARIIAFNWYDDDESMSVLADRIRDAILAACAEQREADAKIMDEAAEDVEEWSLYAPSYFKEKWNAELTIQKWRDRAKAIRSGE